MTGLQIARNVSTATVTVAIKDNRWADCTRSFVPGPQEPPT